MPLALRQTGDGLRQRGAKIARRPRRGTDPRTESVNVDLALFGGETRNLAAGRVLDDAGGTRSSFMPILLGHFHVARFAPDFGFELADRLRDRARLAMHRARRPVELAQSVEHRAADAYARVGFETRAATFRVVRGGFQQAEHAGLDEIVHFDRRGQPPGEVVGDALDELRMAHHQRFGFPGTGALAICAHSGHRTTSSRTAGRLIRRSTKNSTFPRGPSATGQLSARCASVLSATDGRSTRVRRHNGTLFTN